MKDERYEEIRNLAVAWVPEGASDKERLVALVECINEIARLQQENFLLSNQ